MNPLMSAWEEGGSLSFDVTGDAGAAAFIFSKEVRMENKRTLSPMEVSAFCAQIAMMLKAAIPLNDGMAIMEEDSRDEHEKKRLKAMADEVELGTPLSLAMEQAGGFPDYVLTMAKVGEASGNLELVMDSLAAYYEKEDNLRKTVKDALTYPLVMTAMMFIVLYVLMVKVMPIFQGVFSQLGTSISPFAQGAIRFGGIFSQAALAVTAVFVAVCLILYLLGKRNIRFSWLEKCKAALLERSAIYQKIHIRRFAGVTAMLMRAGMDTLELLELTKKLVASPSFADKIDKCSDTLAESGSFVEGLKQMGIFSGFHRQMLAVGSRAGRLDEVLNEIEAYYEEDVERSFESAIGKFEPTVVAVLSIVVGLILMAVMLPLVGLLSSMG